MGRGFTISSLPATQHDPIRNVSHGCAVCGGVGTKVSIPRESNVSAEIRAFYESGRGYKKGAGKIVIEYELVAGPCVHCDGNKCEKCYQTGKNVRLVRQSPYRGFF
jgi:hypothetical protein